MDDRKELWQQFFNNPSGENRERLILSYAPLIKYCAQRIYYGLPGSVDFDDLLSYGSFGLIDAINKYDPKQNNSFEGYAVLRVRGAIIDGLRKMDWAPQSLRRKAKEIEKAYFLLEQKLGRSASDYEVAELMGISKADLEKQLQIVGNLSIISLEQPIDQGEGDFFTLSDFLPDNASPDPIESIEKDEIKMHLEKALLDLNEKEKLVITLFYYEELTVKEISRILELTEGRISQIHKKAISKMKGKIKQIFSF
ncbi:MAG: hypothetical protein JM58_03915 [Peptococcaceae bacterium BICA1-8]|nr:MAG: hypothetical protein JM58_03915 [Peptococcaceae bacterium BICA1-8]